jgi:hypothetical protein
MVDGAENIDACANWVSGRSAVVVELGPEELLASNGEAAAGGRADIDANRQTYRCGGNALGDGADVNQCCRKGGWVAERHGRTKYKHSTDRGSCIQFALVQLGKREPVVIANRGQLQGRKLRQFTLCDGISHRLLPAACLAFGVS